MADLPFPWCIYAEHQSKAVRCGRITDRSWGIENGLTRFLSAVESDGVPKNQAEFELCIARALASGAWVERNHARLRRKYLPPPRDSHAEGRMLARLRLAEIRSKVSEAEWKLLMAVAAGVAYQEMNGMTPGGARIRIARLRARLRGTPSIQAKH